MSGRSHIEFVKPTRHDVDRVVRRRRGAPCDLCGLRRSEDVLVWPVYPEYAAIVGTSPGRAAVVTVGLCGRCKRGEDAAGRAMRQILAFVAARARAKGLPMPPTTEMPVIEVRAGPD
jgi:hypothetical protein